MPTVEEMDVLDAVVVSVQSPQLCPPLWLPNPHRTVIRSTDDVFSVLRVAGGDDRSFMSH